MNRQTKKGIDARLPEAYRGRLGYHALLDSIPLRIAVTGIRGKSTVTRLTGQMLNSRGRSVYAKVTGTRPLSIRDGVFAPIHRDRDRTVVLDETMWEVKKHWPVDAVVLENQAIGTYTMRAFNQLFAKPHYVLLTNIRRDHVGQLGPSKPGIAKAFARSIPRETTVISGERNRQITDILRQEVEQRRARLVDAAPSVREVPGLENVTIVDELLRRTTGSGLRPNEKLKQRRRLRRRYRWQASRLPGVAWFDGAAINDVDSTTLVLDHLQRGRRLPVNFVAYLRRDRPGRTQTLIDFIAGRFERGDARRAFLVGDRAENVARQLGTESVAVVEDRVDRIPELLRTLGVECRGQAVMSIGNAVPPWPRVFSHAMRSQHPRTEPTPRKSSQATPTRRSPTGLPRPGPALQTFNIRPG